MLIPLGSPNENSYVDEDNYVVFNDEDTVGADDACSSQPPPPPPRVKSPPPPPPRVESLHYVQEKNKGMYYILLCAMVQPRAAPVLGWRVRGFIIFRQASLDERGSSLRRLGG